MPNEASRVPSVQQPTAARPWSFVRALIPTSTDATADVVRGPWHLVQWAAPSVGVCGLDVASTLLDGAVLERVAERLQFAPKPMCAGCERFARALDEAQRLQRLRAIEVDALAVCGAFVDFLEIIERPTRWKEYDGGVRELGARLHALLETMGGSAAVIAEACPRCLHTKCGASCSCSCNRKSERSLQALLGELEG